jgi:hypothetical protein
VGPLIHQAVLLGAVGLVGFAALRVAAAAGAAGAQRVVAAAVVGAGIVVLQALALGLAGLVDQPLVLLGAAALTAAAASRLPSGGPLGLRFWWDGAETVERLLAGAGGAVLLGTAAWQLRHPHLGVDGFTYHLPLASAWATGGTPGAIVGAIDGVPVANYPVSNEVVLSWLLSLAGAWTPVSVWTLAVFALWLVALDGLLREVGVTVRRTRALTIAALAVLPVAVTQVGAPLTDVVATTWATCAVALALAARRAPALGGIALLAAGLAVGTKTTPAAALLVGLALCAAAAWRAWGGRLRGAPWLAGGALAGAVCGLVWPLRNLLDHGSPLWPFLSGPGGDPVPPALARFEASFLSDPSVLAGREAAYLQVLAGGVVLLAGAVVVALLARRPWLALAPVAAFGVWANAPYTGIDRDGLAEGATRYLLPALVVSAVVLAVCAPRARRAAHGVLWTALVLSALRTAQLGFPQLPATATVVGLAVAGALVALVATRLRRAPGWVAALAGTLAALVLLAASVDGYVVRHAQAGLPDGALLQEVQARAPAGASVGVGPASVAPLRGDRLERPLAFLPGTSPCAAVRAPRVLVLQRAPRTPQYDALRRCVAGAPAWRDGTYELWIR